MLILMLSLYGDIFNQTDNYIYHMMQLFWNFGKILWSKFFNSSESFFVFIFPLNYIELKERGYPPSPYFAENNKICFLFFFLLFVPI